MNLNLLSITRIYSILIKEFFQLKRDKTTLRIMILIPIIQLLVFGFAINSDPKHLSTGIYLEDNSIISRRMISALEKTEYFDIKKELKSVDEGLLGLQDGSINFLIIVPSGFSKKLIRDEKPSVIIQADATDPVAVSGALGVIKPALDRAIYSELIKFSGFENKNENLYELKIQKLYNPEGLSRFNIIPGLIGIVLTMTGVMMTALSLTKERERGTMENLLAMPVLPIEVMLGKIAPYIMIAYIQATIIMLAAYFIFGVPILGDIHLLYFALLIFIICNLALGFTLSAAATNQVQAMQMSMFIILPSILLSGFMFPFKGMPLWAQVIGSCIPSTYFIRIMRGLMLKGSSFTEIWPNVWPLFIFMIVMSMIAMRVYKRTLD